MNKQGANTKPGESHSMRVGDVGGKIWDLTNKKKELGQIPGPISITYYIIYLKVLNSPRGTTRVG